MGEAKPYVSSQGDSFKDESSRLRTEISLIRANLTEEIAELERRRIEVMNKARRLVVFAGLSVAVAGFLMSSLRQQPE